jgi:DNA-directed RNA polymerase specialized sigma24 family protein
MNRRNRRKAIPTFAASTETLKAALMQSYRDRFRICELSWIDGWSSTQVAHALNLKPAAVRMVLLRARKEFESRNHD